MDPSTETIFLQAIELPKASRGDYLAKACAGDDRLRAAVEALLWADEHPGILTRSPVSPSLAAAVAESMDVGHGMEGPGSVIGPYTLLEALGEGGFGRVFLAEQDKPVRRRVALKILKAGMDTRQIIARFEAERQALAMMDHPAIARVYDAGATSAGRPYFAMELVKGIPLTDYADNRKLTLRQRLALFRDVCLAIQHAHSKGIIHRDIKPSNILVADGDDTPQPKVIDFGIAKATGGRLSDKSVYTQAAQWLGTPEYMAPEQAGGGPPGASVDTRSDIYSLGATLYELLAGVTPFDALRIRSASYDQIARMIREDDPPRPSARLSRLGDQTREIAAKRATDSNHLAGALKGDLDWIAMRCLDKDPARRYETAAALSADIQRYLDDKPIEARPPTAGYQVGKWVRRNRGAFAAACAVGVAIIVGVVGLTVGLVRAAEEARRAERSAEQANAAAADAAEARAIAEREADAALAAEREARAAEEAALAAAERERQAALRAQRALDVAEQQRERAEAVQRFIAEDLLGEEGEDEPLSPAFTVHQMVDRAERRLDQGASTNRPEFAAAMRHAIGLLFMRTGEYHKAARHLRISVELLDALPTTPDQEQLADAVDALGVALNYLDRLPEAVAAHQRALDIRLALRDSPDPPDDIAEGLQTSYANLGGAAADMGDLTRAESLLRQALAIAPEGGETANTMINLGMVLAHKGEVAEGERVLREGIEAARNATDRAALAASGMALLGELLVDNGRHAEAVEPLRESAEIRSQIFGPEHRFTISTRTVLGRALMPTDPDAAMAELRWAAAAARLNLAPEDVYRLNAEQRLAMTLYQQSDYAAAEVAMRELGPLMRLHFGPTHTGLGGYLFAFADTLTRLGGPERLAEADMLLRECLALRQRAYRPNDRNHWLIEETRETLAAVLLERARLAPAPEAAIALLEEAEPMLLTAIDAMDPPSRPEEREQRCLQRLVDLYELWNSLAPDQNIADRAAPFRARLAG
ncbi:MAG: serine/threonine-protein kinase [Phycisphaerales bacterium]